MIDLNYDEIYSEIQKALQNQNYKDVESKLMDSFFLYMSKLLSINGFLKKNLAKLMEYDMPTFYHSIRVGFLAFALTKRYELFDKSIKTFVVAGIFHDIGKMLLDKNVLNKNGKLNSEEMTHVQEHTRNGFNILKQYSTDIAEVVVAHHEFQGNSYPRQELREPKSEIMKMAYIISIIDSFDALINEREYKPGISVLEASSIIKEKYAYKEAEYVLECVEELL